MARDQRGAVVSVRITDEEQARLREVAQDRGTSVSELVRSAVIRELSPVSEPVGTAVSVSPTSQASQIEQGIFWRTDDRAQVPTPGTLIIHG